MTLKCQLVVNRRNISGVGTGINANVILNDLALNMNELEDATISRDFLILLDKAANINTEETRP